MGACQTNIISKYNSISNQFTTVEETQCQVVYQNRYTKDRASLVRLSGIED